MWGIWGKPRERFSLEELKHLSDVLQRQTVITEANKDTIVETLRSIAELMIWGDQHEPAFFEYFVDHGLFAHIVHILSVANKTSSSGVIVQLLQTLNIMLQNIKSEKAIYYLFSKEYMNNVITFPFDFSDEELLAYYISFLKVISMKLDKSTISYFLVKREDGSLSFPLYVEAIRFFHHEESMVRIAVRTITLTVYHVEDERIPQFVLCPSSIRYFEDLAIFVRQQSFTLARLVANASRNVASIVDMGRVEGSIAEIGDLLYYCNDVMNAGIPDLSEVVSEHLASIWLFPILLASLVPEEERGSPNAKRISPLCSMYLLSRVFYVISYRPFVELAIRAIVASLAASEDVAWTPKRQAHAPEWRKTRSDPNEFQAVPSVLESSQGLREDPPGVPAVSNGGEREVGEASTSPSPSDSAVSGSVVGPSSSNKSDLSSDKSEAEQTRQSKKAAGGAEKGPSEEDEAGEPVTPKGQGTARRREATEGLGGIWSSLFGEVPSETQALVGHGSSPSTPEAGRSRAEQAYLGSPSTPEAGRSRAESGSNRTQTAETVVVAEGAKEECNSAPGIAVVSARQTRAELTMSTGGPGTKAAEGIFSPGVFRHATSDSILGLYSEGPEGANGGIILDINPSASAWETTVSFLLCDNERWVLAALCVMCGLLHNSAVQEDLLDELGILPSHIRHRRMLVEALVGDKSSEEDLKRILQQPNAVDSAAAGRGRDAGGVCRTCGGIPCEAANDVDAELESRKPSGSFLLTAWPLNGHQSSDGAPKKCKCKHLRDGRPPKLTDIYFSPSKKHPKRRRQVIDALFVLLCRRPPPSPEALWHAGWLLQQLLPSNARLSPQHLALLNHGYELARADVIVEMLDCWSDLLPTALDQEWRTTRKALDSATLANDSSIVLLPSLSPLLLDGDTSSAAYGERMRAVVKVFVVIHRMRCVLMGMPLPETLILADPTPAPSEARSGRRGVSIAQPQEGEEVSFAVGEAMPCRVAFERGKEKKVLLIVATLGPAGWIILAESDDSLSTPRKKLEETPPASGEDAEAGMVTATVRVVAPLAGSQPTCDPKHKRWLHLRIRSPQQPLPDAGTLASRSPMGSRARTKRLADGRWTLAFPDEQQCRRAQLAVMEEIYVQANSVRTTLEPVLGPLPPFKLHRDR